MFDKTFQDKVPNKVNRVRSAKLEKLIPEKYALHLITFYHFYPYFFDWHPHPHPHFII